MKFLTIKKSYCAIVLVAIIVICAIFGVRCAVRSANSSTTPKAAYTIVIDAGHGGIDGGAVGQTGVTEADLNLQFSYVLKSLCEKYGFNVVLTRKDENGLYSIFASNKKRSEMKKRKEIIEKSNADIVVSVHMNSFSLSSARGAQVYYASGSECGQALAESVQSALHQEIEYAKTTPKSEDFYLLKCTDAPSILVECGFLSNTEEEILLCDSDYQQKFCYTLLYGILNYFSLE